METIQLEVKKRQEVDVFVAGGGFGGCAAAIAAARAGGTVMLAEQWGTLGGSATLSLALPTGALHSLKGKSFGGLASEIFTEVTRLAREYAAANSNLTVSPHIIKFVLMQKLVEAGVKLSLHSRLVDVKTDGERVTEAILHTKSGIKAVKAKMFIDATGDADLVFLAGDNYYKGVEDGVYQSLTDLGLNKVHEDDSTENDDILKGKGDGLQPCSSMFILGGVDEEAGKKYINAPITYENMGIDPAEYKTNPYFNTVGFEENGNEVPLPQGRVLYFASNRKGEVVVNMSRVLSVDATDEESLTYGEIWAQLQVIYITDFLKKYVDGFQNCYLIESSVYLGIRETRRLEGQYMVTASDVIECKRFEDTIAHGSSIIDIHDPFGKRKAVGGSIQGEFYNIPYRSLLSAKFANLAAVGRCLSADHVAHSSTRIQGTCILTGQAAGMAAVMAADGETDFGKVDVKALQEGLISQKVNLAL